VNKLCDKAQENGITIVRDKNVMRVGDRISEFMQELARADRRVFIILSDKYLKSPFCMYELFEVWRNCRQDDAEFLRRIRVFTLSDAKIWTPADRVLCAVHWQNESRQVESLVTEHGLQTMGEKDHKRLRLMKQFETQIGDILATVADVLQPRTFEKLEQYGFADPPG
jgi:internalin A